MAIVDPEVVKFLEDLKGNGLKDLERYFLIPGLPKPIILCERISIIRFYQPSIPEVKMTKAFKNRGWIASGHHDNLVFGVLFPENQQFNCKDH